MTSNNTNNYSPPSLLPTTSTITTPFHNLLSDCIHQILHYHEFLLQHGKRWMRGESYSVVHVADDSRITHDFELHGMADSDWNFLCKFAHCCCFLGDDGLEEFLSACRDWDCKPTFSNLHLQYVSAKNLINTGALEFLRGIPNLHLRFFLHDGHTDLNPLFRNIRGVKTIHLQDHHGQNRIPIKTEYLENLRGIQEAGFSSCDFSSMSVDAFENLRGIKSLTLLYCSFQPSAKLFENLGGIRELVFEFCHGFHVSSQNFRNIRGLETFVCSGDCSIGDQDLQHLRGVKVFRFRTDVQTDVPLSDDSFKNLRGVRKLELSCEIQITDSAMVNLRGAEEIGLNSLPNLTSAVVENFRGVRKVTISNCPGISNGSRTLYNLHGVEELDWKAELTTFVDEESVKRLFKVKSLKLDNVRIVDGKSLSYLSEMRQLFLSSGADILFSRDADISSWDKLEHLAVCDMHLRTMDDFSSLLQLPKLNSISFARCFISEDIAVTSPLVQGLLNFHEAYFALKKQNGEWTEWKW